MHIHSTSVALLKCSGYQTQEIAEKIDQLCKAVGFQVSRGTRVLLKPNLLSGRSADHLACTHPVFVAAAAEWFVAQGAKVAIGDSPAFGTAKGVMRVVGIEEAVAGLPVERINFEHKPCWHLRYGSHAEQFASHLVDLLPILPAGITLLDGIVAMHGTGPVSGQPYPLGLIAGAVNPVALDTALLQILGLDAAKSPLWLECAKRDLAGADSGRLDYPLEKPEEFLVTDFKVPKDLKSVSFNPLRMLASACRRYAAQVKESS
jgi:uncharacterized protein (DUF362 family)